jgi:hypothetical protein
VLMVSIDKLAGMPICKANAAPEGPDTKMYLKHSH